MRLPDPSRHPGAALTASAIACVLASSTVAQTSSRFFSVRSSPLFADVRQQLQTLVDEGGSREQNRFCVVGQRVAGGRQAYVYWTTERRLILWEPQRGNPRAIAGSRRNLSLETDVVDGDDAGGSTYRLTRATANGIIRACQAKGSWYRLRRTGAHA